MENNLPKGWDLSNINTVCSITTGKRDVNEGNPDGQYPFFTCAQDIFKINNYEFDGEAILVAGNGFFNVKYYNGKFNAYQRTYILQDFQIISKYLYYYISAKLSDITKDNRGSTIRYIRLGDLADYEIPLPTLPEQGRIVAKLDALMQKVESNKKRLDKIPKLLKRFRQSVLAAAVSGKLTEDWREKNKKVTIYSTENKIENYDWRNLDFPLTWKWDFIKNISEHILGKMLDAAKNKGEPTLYLRNISVRWFEFDLETLTEIKATKEDKVKFDLLDGDLFVCEGGEPGRAAVWSKGKNNYIFQKAIHRIRLNEFVNPYWVLYNLKVDADGGNLETLFTGTGIKHLTLKSLSKYPVAIPPLKEQKEIVRRVEQLFAFADKIEARYTKTKAMLDKLSQSILAKAFRGELVPQNPVDEPASMLLKRIASTKLRTSKKEKVKLNEKNLKHTNIRATQTGKKIKYSKG
jgi:type I restriction enzyme S subunit